MFASSDSSSALLVCLASVFCASGPHDDLAVEDRARLIREDALVHLVAAAMRHRVVDGRVVVDQLRAAADVEAIQRAVDAFAVERGDDVVADQAAAERQRVRRESAAASGVQEHAGDVECVRGLFLQLVVIDHGVDAEPDLADGVRERDALDPRSVRARSPATPRRPRSAAGDATSIPPFSDTEANVISIGCSMTPRAGITTTMPSRRNAVLSDVKALVCVSDELGEVRFEQRGCEASAASSPRICTPFGSLSRFDESAAQTGR